MLLRNRPILHSITAAILCAALTATSYAPPPAWWSDSATRILANPPVTPDNYAVANLGQLKHVAAMAKKHLDQHLATWGGAGPGVNAVVAGFVQATPDNFAPANLGQLKAVAKPFYDRLREVGMNTNASLRANGYPANWTHDYPWNPNDPWNQPTPPGATVDKTANLAPVNLGQLKMAFSFDLAKDTDGDLMPDWWESAHGLSATDPTDAGQTGGGGMSNLQHFANGSSPSAPAPTANITVGTPQGGLDATQSIYPPGGVGSKLINGDFSSHPITSGSWQRFYGTAGAPGWGFRLFGVEYGYGAIPGWSAIAGTTGTVLELQKSGTNQYCELDADWTLPRPAEPRPDSDHGIQQMTMLSRGSYILAFDYKGRTWGPNQQNIAGDFVVTVQSGMTGTPVEVFRKNGAVADWKRAINIITIEGGTANGPAVPVLLKFDITDAADSYGALIDNVVLLPVEMRITDRDDPKKKWTDNVVKTAPVYSGKSTGDMVSWKLGGTDSWTSATFSWSAEGPEYKEGPSGTGKNEWKIADGDEDTAKDWLDWKPGKYKIKCAISLAGGGTLTAEFEQEVGVRTDDIVVVGWINRQQVPLNPAGVQSALTEVLPLAGFIAADGDNAKLKAALLLKGTSINPHFAVSGIGYGQLGETGCWKDDA